MGSTRDHVQALENADEIWAGWSHLATLFYEVDGHCLAHKKKHPPTVKPYRRPMPTPPLGPYNRPPHRVLGQSYGDPKGGERRYAETCTIQCFWVDSDTILCYGCGCRLATPATPEANVANDNQSASLKVTIVLLKPESSWCVGMDFSFSTSLP